MISAGYAVLRFIETGHISDSWYWILQDPLWGSQKKVGLSDCLRGIPQHYHGTRFSEEVGERVAAYHVEITKKPLCQQGG